MSKLVTTSETDYKDIETLQGDILISRVTATGNKEIGVISLYTKHEKSINQQVNDFCYSNGVNPVTTDLIIQEADLCMDCDNFFAQSELEEDIDGAGLVCQKCVTKRKEDFNDFIAQQNAEEAGYAKDSWTYGMGRI